MNRLEINNMATMDTYYRKKSILICKRRTQNIFLKGQMTEKFPEVPLMIKLEKHANMNSRPQRSDENRDFSAIRNHKKHRSH